MRSSLALVALPRSTSRRLRAGAFAAIAGSALLLSALPAAAQSKVAVIDVRRAIGETEAGLRVKSALQKILDKSQGEFDAKVRRHQADKEALAKEAQTIKAPTEQFQRKVEALQRSEAELQALGAESQRDMQRKESEMTTPIYQCVLDAVKSIAALEGFEMVMEKSAVPYYRGDLDLTDRAIQICNSRQPGGAAPAAPAAPAVKGAPAAPAGKDAPVAPAPKPAPKK